MHILKLTKKNNELFVSTTTTTRSCSLCPVSFVPGKKRKTKDNKSRTPVSFPSKIFPT